ncbi:transmembrane protein 177-like [Mizuhopecten yessoensis]|uniref:Transmembrane protein 177 n=1 Tax=Mizuhopecten yessoensis TaxID=6573 RepID=A0A210R358_MIZYE|nr:transmembrane protein 177-like [Mizuhopecten yessoensis]XP_021367785.1 transmembrane protein 177-like [Mizuhopecten yessoensis]OWF55493.1 Transmembrane protein 177 [Mizuhopecten yessoensis]
MAARILQFWKRNSDVIHAIFGSAWLGIGYASLLAYQKRQPEITLHKENIPVEVDKKSLSMSEEILDEKIKSCKAPGNVESLLEPLFVTVGSEAVSLGSLKNRFGGVVGIPYCWRYSTSEDIESVDIALRSKTTSDLTTWMVMFMDYVYALPKSSIHDVITTKHSDCDVVKIEENSQAMDALKESLILSDQAKAFAYLREIGYLNSHHQNVAVGMGVVSLGMGGIFGYFAQTILQAKFAMKPGRVLQIVVLAHVVAYKVSLDWFKASMDFYLKKRDETVDQDLVDKGLTKGGIEFYEKLIQKNLSLRTLLGSQGEELYSKDGNEIYPNYRFPHLPLTQQRDKLVKQLNSEALNEV